MINLCMYIKNIFQKLHVCIETSFIIDVGAIIPGNKKFINKKNMLDKILQSLMYTVITFCMGYSIFTNFIFWSSVNKNIISAIMYATIFDVASIVLCLMTYKYDTLEFKQEYLDEINLTSDEKTVEKNDNSDDTIFLNNLKRGELEDSKERLKKLQNNEDVIDENEINDISEFSSKMGLQKV